MCSFILSNSVIMYAHVALLMLLLTTMATGESCSWPPWVEFAWPSVEPWEKEFPVGTSVSYTCQLGTFLEGKNSTISCVLVGRSASDWTAIHFSCIKPTEDQTKPGWFRRFFNWIKCKIYRGWCS